MQQPPDFVREPYLGWCEMCHEWVITLNGHCINDDSHKTSMFTPDERKNLYSNPYFRHQKRPDVIE